LGNNEREIGKIRFYLSLFMLGLVVSGLTAFPLKWELELLAHWLSVPAGASPESYEGLQKWICFVRNGLKDTYAKYPFVAYGTDWLAFAHLVLALLFIGPYRDPVKNIWVIEFGLWACVLVLPLALLCGPLRGIPFYWRMVDCSFGVIGFMVLYPGWRSAKKISSRPSKAAFG
jgi:hypothetical protein